MALRSRKKSKKKDNKVSEDKFAPAENAEETSAEATPGVEGRVGHCSIRSRCRFRSSAMGTNPLV